MTKTKRISIKEVEAYVPEASWELAHTLFHFLQENNISIEITMGAFAVVLDYAARFGGSSREQLLATMIANAFHIDDVLEEMDPDKKIEDEVRGIIDKRVTKRAEDHCQDCGRCENADKSELN